MSWAWFRCCTFCRRHVVQLGSVAQKLQELGVQTLGVVATTPEQARLYFRFRPPRIPMGTDPDLMTHRTYRLPHSALTPEVFEWPDSPRRGSCAG